jgi:hypothetical protein
MISEHEMHHAEENGADNPDLEGPQEVRRAGAEQHEQKRRRGRDRWGYPAAAHDDPQEHRHA